MKTYKYPITKLKPNQIFVFGSNTQGKHRSGAARFAIEDAGAIYGQAAGLQGNSFAIITKDLTKKIHPSVSKDKIIWQIQTLYLFAQTVYGKTKEWLVAYNGDGVYLSGFTPKEMATMFSLAATHIVTRENKGIPDNIIFEEEFAKLL